MLVGFPIGPIYPQSLQVMSKHLVSSFLTTGLLLGVAHGAIVFSSIGNTGGTTSIVSGGGGNSGKAISFVMPAGSDYNLTSVVLNLDGIADAGVETPLITIWSNDTVTTATPIGSLLNTLTLSGTLVDGQNTFTSSGLTLNAGATYWLVVRNSSSGTAGNEFGWISGTGAASTGTNTGRVFSNSGTDIDPSTWSGTSSLLNAAQINADVIPEPSVAMLGGVLGLLMLRRRR